jgi:hypothetical protein
MKQTTCCVPSLSLNGRLSVIAYIVVLSLLFRLSRSKHDPSLRDQGAFGVGPGDGGLLRIGRHALALGRLC